MIRIVIITFIFNCTIEIHHKKIQGLMKELGLKARIHAKRRDHSYKRDKVRKANNLIEHHLRLLKHLKSA